MQLESGVSYKDMYYTSEERVKLYYYQVPRARTNLRTTVQIQALTEGFYPTVLVSKNVHTNTIDDPSTKLTYPNFGSANFTFGDNFTDVAQANTVSTHKFNNNRIVSFSSTLLSETMQTIPSLISQLQSILGPTGCLIRESTNSN